MSKKKNYNIGSRKAGALYNYVKVMPDDAPVDMEANKRVFFKRIKRRERKKYIFRYAAAAAVILLLSNVVFFGFFSDKSTLNNKSTIVNNNIISGKNNAMLTLENGTKVVLGQGRVYRTESAEGNDEVITYNNKKVQNTVYNYLTVPRGGKYKLVLSDGTSVWLNSESQLKFPVAFTADDARTVELVYGEAFFDVSPSEKNAGTSFKVWNKDQEIEVLGTEFNVKAYKGDTRITTTLVEGKVAVGSSASEKKYLAPNQQAILDLDTKKMEINTVEDVFNDISWKNDIFSFDDKSLKDIMKELSRWYSIDNVVFEKEELKGAKYVGVINRNQDIVDILSIMRDLDIIDSYDINDRTITLK